jgi:hypothetical protein
MEEEPASKKHARDVPEPRNGEEEAVRFWRVFRVNMEMWEVDSKIEEMGYLYSHRMSARPLVILRTLNLNDEHTGYVVMGIMRCGDIEQQVISVAVPCRPPDDLEFREMTVALAYFDHHYTDDTDAYLNEGGAVYVREALLDHLHCHDAALPEEAPRRIVHAKSVING